jgi:hypothetical protein
MPYGYGSTNTSTSSRDTGSDYGQFDRAVSQAANNPAPSQPSGPPGGGDPQMTYTAPSQPSVGGDDIDSIYTDTSFNVTPEVQEKSFVEKMVDYYKGGGILGLGIRKIGGMLNPENQYEGITGEDIYDTPSQYAQDVLNIDYESLDNEGQTEIDQQYFDAGYRSDAFQSLYEGGDISNIDNLTGSESAAIEQLIPQESYRIGNTTPVESQVDKWFASNPVGTGLDPNYMTTYNTAKANIAATLGMVDTSNQFGYSSDPYGGLTAQNLATNPFDIPYMQERGLI